MFGVSIVVARVQRFVLLTALSFRFDFDYYLNQSGVLIKLDIVEIRSAHSDFVYGISRIRSDCN